MDRSALDLSAFRDFPSQDVGHAVPRLSINEKGRLSMNTAFRKAVGSARAFRGMYTEDGSRLLFLSDREPNIRFFSGQRHRAQPCVGRYFEKAGLQVSVLYYDGGIESGSRMGGDLSGDHAAAGAARIKAKRKRRSAKGETA